MYVKIMDEEGNVAVVRRNDPTLVQAQDWTEWKIDLAEVATSADLARVVKLTIGVGEPLVDHPYEGPRLLAGLDAQGAVYIDQLTNVSPGFGLLMGFVRDTDVIGAPIVPAKVGLYTSTNTGGTAPFQDVTSAEKDFYAIFMLVNPYTVKVTSSNFRQIVESWPPQGTPMHVVNIKDYVMRR